MDKPVFLKDVDGRPLVSIGDLLDKYGDLSEATPEELDAASKAVWKQAVVDAEAERARREARPKERTVGGLADLCDSAQGTARSRTVEALLLAVTDVERVMLECCSYFERIATDADLWLDRDPARGFDGDDMQRLTEERAALYARIQGDAAQVAQRADRLRTML